ncbi:hypothetical protein MKY54_02415 [Paenibacillus sp. FSL P2-0121]|jgi:hypothetical protein|uniref:hypothetical protein n=1 Tax=Paenibacillus sp. FSL P2-0121 TaxID=2921626 RepID=UPI00096F2B6B|nr:hypothetical protein BSK50_03220 [Paenibacillus odorifer]
MNNLFRTKHLHNLNIIILEHSVNKKSSPTEASGHNPKHLGIYSLLELLKPYHVTTIGAYKVPTVVGNVPNNTKDLLEDTGSAQTRETCIGGFRIFKIHHN